MKLLNYFLLTLLLGCYTVSKSQELIINEVMASNASGLTDTDGSTPDWIEIYNSGVAAINLSEYGVSDKSSSADAWHFPDKTIEPNSYFLLFAIGDDADFKTYSFYETILDIGDEMNYILPKTAVDPTWNTLGFNDSGWQSGRLF